MTISVSPSQIQSCFFPKALQFNVQNWLISSRFSDYDNGSTGSSSPPNIGAYYIDTPPVTYGDVNHHQQQDQEQPAQKSGTYTLLQREKTSILSTPKGCLNGRSELGVVGFRRKHDLKKSFKSTYEDKLGGLTEIAVDVLEKIVAELKTTELAGYISQVKTVSVTLGVSVVLVNRIVKRENVGLRYGLKCLCKTK